jgi:hypothetical protein
LGKEGGEQGGTAVRDNGGYLIGAKWNFARYRRRSQIKFGDEEAKGRLN